MDNSTTAATDPIERLPYETWLKCLYFASSDSENGPLPFLFISHRWFRAILDEPSLWSTITLSGRGEDELARVYTFLYLSGGHFLDIILTSPNFDYALDSLEMIVSQAQRVRSITMHAVTGLSDGPLVDRCFTTGGSSYPQLRRIDIDDGTPEWDKMIPLCPSLQGFCNVRIPLPMALPSTLRHIARIQLTSLDEALLLIQKRGLRHLGIDYSSITGRIDDRARAEHAYKLSQTTVCQITHLEVHLQTSMLKILSTIISALPQLWSLSLTVWGNRPEVGSWTPPPLSADYITHIRIFSMDCLISEYNETIDVEKAFMPILSIASALSEVHSFTLMMHSTAPMIAIHKLISSIPQVRRLRLELNGGIDEQDLPPVILNDIIHLDLSSALLLRYFAAPNALSVSLEDDFEIYELLGPSISQFQNPNLLLTELAIQLEYFDEINSAFPEEGIKTQWPSLHKIHLWGRDWCETLIYVDSLREICFEAPSIPVFDGFLLDLLRSSDAFPNLRIIKSRNYPRWELLFEVMRRRNRENIPIKQLSIRGYPVPAILTRLVLLLQGQEDVYTGRDIDEVIYKRCNGKEPIFHVCGYCSFLGYTSCNPESSSARLSEEHLSSEAMDLLELCGDSIAPPAQPRDTKKWEDITTIEEWYEMYPKIRTRDSASHCQRTQHSSLVDITGSTLDGVYGPGVMGNVV